MVRLEEDGVEFYDDTQGVPSYGQAPSRGPRYERPSRHRRHYRQYPEQRGGERDDDEQVIPSEGDFDRRRRFPYDEMMTPFGGNGFDTQYGGVNNMFDEMERSMRSAFSGFGDMNGLMRGFMNGSDVFGDMFPTNPHGGGRIDGISPFEGLENGQGGSSSYSYSYSTQSYGGPDGRVYEEKRVRNSNGEEQVTVRRRLGEMESEQVTMRGADGIESNDVYYRGVEPNQFESQWDGTQTRSAYQAGYTLPETETSPRTASTASASAPKKWWNRFVNK